MEHCPFELPRLFTDSEKSKVVFRGGDGSLKQIVFNDPSAAENAMAQLQSGKTPVADEGGTLVEFV